MKRSGGGGRNGPSPRPARPDGDILNNQAGSSLVLVAMSMVVFLGFSALAIDVGMLYNAKGQAQNAADSGALAGAGAMLLNPLYSGPATIAAEAFGEKHEVFGEMVEILPAEDVIVDLADERVTVTVRRIAARNNAVPTFFAKILGWDTVDIEATATARLGCAGASSCLKPWAIPDAFDDVNGDGWFNEGDYYEPAVTSYGSTYRGSDRDFGLEVVLKSSSPGDTIAPGQFFPVNLPLETEGPITGGEKYRENIGSCNGEIVEIGDSLMTETGNMIGPTVQGVKELIDQDSGAWWDPAAGVADSAFPPGASPRIVRVPMFDPRYPPTSGKVEVLITNIAGLFIEGISSNGQVTGRLMAVAGSPVGGSCQVSLLKMVQLVE